MLTLTPYRLAALHLLEPALDLTTPAYDLGVAHVALVRHAVASSLDARRRPLAALLARQSDAWTLIALDVDAMPWGSVSGSYTITTLSAVVRLMAQGRVDTAIWTLAEACGESVDEWQREAVSQ